MYLYNRPIPGQLYFGGFYRPVVSCWFHADMKASFIYRSRPMAYVECYSVAIHAFGLAITCLSKTVVM